MTAVGFDFGTTTSIISLCRSSDINVAECIFGSDGLPIPSVVAYQGNQTLVGADAKNILDKMGLGVIGGDAVRSPKILLGRENVMVGGISRDPVDLVFEVVNYVKTFTENEVGQPLAPFDEAVVTIPVNMNGLKRAYLRAAFNRAAIRIRQFIHEPLAALYGYIRSQDDVSAMLRNLDRNLILVFDWGGGTLDIALCRVEGDTLFQLANFGTEDVGGDRIDEEFRNFIERKAYELHSVEQQNPPPLEARKKLLHECEKAKISLSEHQEVDIFISEFFSDGHNPDLSVRVKRRDLEACAQALIDKAFYDMDRLIGKQGYGIDSIAYCLVTGGTTQMPAIKSRLYELFGPARVWLGGASLVSKGAAFAAADAAELTLAKDIQISLARNNHATLIPAKTIMPQKDIENKVHIMEDQFHLYCVDPRDGNAKFEIVTPAVPGSNPLFNNAKITLAAFTLKIDSQLKPFQERLELYISIDENLILKVQAKSFGRMKDIKDVEIYDLEFALKVKVPDLNPKGPSSDDDGDNQGRLTHIDSSTGNCGNLAFRSNIAIAEDIDDILIPGELMAVIRPQYFYLHNRPPQIQVDENLLYANCACCGRAYNDPLCRC